MAFALLFSGQGLQQPAMLPWLDDDGAGMAAVQRIAGHDWRAALADPAAAGRNAFAQPLLTALALAAWAQLAPGLPPPAAVAGYSVGELAACSAAGACTADAAVALARQRAEAMDRATTRQPPTGLLGVSGLPLAAIDALCARHGVAIAIRSGTATAVLGGPRPALAAAQAEAAAMGAHCTPLNVALASHTHWMADAAQAFADLLAAMPADVLHTPRAALFACATGARVPYAASLRSALATQIDRTVRWDDCMDGIAERGVACVLEIGAGSALARQWNARHPAIPARAADEFRSAAAVGAWVRRQGDPHP